MKASIDIGSNTVLLLVGEVHDGKVTVIDERQEAPRLGQGVDAEKNLTQQVMQRVIDVVNEFKMIIEHDYPDVDEVIVMATSAVRDANNRLDFVREVKKATGYSVQILSGKQEARLTYLGAKSVLQETNHPSAVIDIGGGSTEVAYGNAKNLIDWFSFNIGSVRFTERYLKSDPPTEKEIENCRTAITDALKKHPFEWNAPVDLIGVAGTVTSLAAIQNNIKTYQPEKLNGQKLSFNDLTGWISSFSEFTKTRLLNRYPNILEGRAGIFVAGLLILEEFMKAYDVNEVTTSTGGIRHGALIIN